MATLIGSLLLIENPLIRLLIVKDTEGVSQSDTVGWGLQRQPAQ